MPKKNENRGRSVFNNNYTGSVTKSLSEFLRWQWQRSRSNLPPPARVPTPVALPDLAFIARNANAGAAMVPAVTWIGHASVLVQAGGLNILTDPVFSKRVSPVPFLGPKRAQSPGMPLRELPRIDVVVVSHNHYDHLDKRTVQALARQAEGSPLFLVPLGVKSWLRRFGITRAAELGWWESHRYEDVEFHFTPAQHWSGRSLTDRNKTLWGGWVGLGEDCHWFFSGDTGYSADFVDVRNHFAERQTAARGGGFDVGLIAVGACEPRWFMKPQHVNPAEAVQIHLDLNAKRSVGVHWGTFQLSDEPLDHAIDALDSARRQFQIDPQSFKLLAIGETLCIPHRR